MSLDQLRVTLMALLPTGGTVIGVSQLGDLAVATRREVMEALTPAVRAGEVRYHVGADAFSVVKKGDAL